MANVRTSKVEKRHANNHISKKSLRKTYILHRESYGMVIPNFTAKESLKKSGDYGSFTTSKSLVDITPQMPCDQCVNVSQNVCCPEGQCYDYSQPAQCSGHCKKPDGS
jgi:hypothetical protein